MNDDTKNDMEKLRKANVCFFEVMNEKIVP